MAPLLLWTVTIPGLSYAPPIPSPYAEAWPRPPTRAALLLALLQASQEPR